MPEYPWRSSAELRAECMERGYRIRDLGEAPLGGPLWCIEAGGAHLPAILLTAGSHADEVAGVFAALRLAAELDTAHHVVIMPLRDPLGWRGFRAALEEVTGRPLTLSDHGDAVAMLRTGDIVWEEEDFVLSAFGELVFGAQPIVGWHSSTISRHRLPRLMREHPEVQDKLRGRRIVLPGNIGHQEDRGPYDWGGNTAYVGTSGYAAQFNRFFDRSDAPTEVEVPRALAAELRPGLTIDLHEGFSDKYYVFATGPEDRGLCAAMITGVRRVGGQAATFEDLRSSWGPSTANIRDLGDGVFTIKEPGTTSQATLSGYCSQSGQALTTEPGMDASVADRTTWIVAGVREAVRYWESTKQHDNTTERTPR